MTLEQFEKAKAINSSRRECIAAREELTQIYNMKDATLECKRACDIASTAIDNLIRMYDDAFNKI